MKIIGYCYHLVHVYWPLHQKDGVGLGPDTAVSICLNWHFHNIGQDFLFPERSSFFPLSNKKYFSTKVENNRLAIRTSRIVANGSCHDLDWI